MAPSIFHVRRRTLLCGALLFLAVALTVALASAQDEAQAQAAVKENIHHQAQAAVAEAGEQDDHPYDYHETQEGKVPVKESAEAEAKTAAAAAPEETEVQHHHHEAQQGEAEVAEAGEAATTEVAPAAAEGTPETAAEQYDHHQDQEGVAPQEEAGQQQPEAESQHAEEEAAAAAQRQAEEEAAAQQRQAEEEAERQRRQAEEEAERQRRQAEEEAERQRRQAEEEAAAAARRQAEEQERIRREQEAAAEAERQRQAAEEEAARQRREQEARARREAEDRKRKEEAEQARKLELEKSKRQVDSIDQIRHTAKELKGGCAKAVEDYLFRVHEQRQNTAAAVGHARAQLNEARLNAPSEVEKLEKQLAGAQDALHVYDVRTLRLYGGNLPKTCIAEAQHWYGAQPAVQSENQFLQAYTHFYRLLGAHLYTMYTTAEGLVRYIIDSYAPAVMSLTTSISEYQNKTWAIYEEVFLAAGGVAKLPPLELAKKTLTLAGYASVSIGLGVAAGIVAVVALPPVAAYVIAYEYLYKIWAELFIFYYIYGMKLPEGVIAAFRGVVAAVKTSQWNVLSTKASDALFDLVVDSDTIFYNGIIAIFLLSQLVMIGAILMCLWCRCCVPGMGGRKTKPSPLAQQSNSNNKKQQQKKSPSPANKKASPAPAPAEKKKK